eukprot:468426-Pelagomonas_calceolata.AAC.1
MEEARRRRSSNSSSSSSFLSDTASEKGEEDEKTLVCIFMYSVKLAASTKGTRTIATVGGCSALLPLCLL